MQLIVEVKISEQISKLTIYDFLYADMHHFKFSWIESTKGELIVYFNYILSSSYSTSNGGLVDYTYLNYMM